MLEDFHYLSERVQKDLAFLLKAMGEYGLFVIAVGVWPKDHLLTYYNGDLDGRVEDIHLKWSDEELATVVEQGCEALRINIAESVKNDLVREASGSVGLVQRLAEQLCRAEGIESSTPLWNARRTIGTSESLNTAKRAVAEQMEGRFQTFADNFVRGMRRLPEGLEVYKFLLQAATDATDEELTEGIDSAALLTAIADHGGQLIRASDLTQALDRIDRLQVKIDVSPPVLTYGKASRKLFLADRAFLFSAAMATRDGRGCPANLRSRTTSPKAIRSSSTKTKQPEVRRNADPRWQLLGNLAADPAPAPLGVTAN